MGFFSNEEFIRYKKCTQPVYQTPASIQQMLDIAGVHENGIFEIEPNNGAGKKRRKFDRVYSFSDLNYVDQDKQQKDGILFQLRKFLNSMDTDFKITIQCEPRDVTNFQKSLLQDENKSEYPELARYNNEMIKKSLEKGQENVRKQRYLTVSANCRSIEEAEGWFDTFEHTALPIFHAMGSELVPLNAVQRFQKIRNYFFTDDGEESFILPFQDMVQAGRDFRNSILPHSVRNHKSYMEFDEECMRILFAAVLPTRLNEEKLIFELTDFPFYTCLTIDTAYIPREVLRGKISNTNFYNENAIGQEVQANASMGNFYSEPSYAKKKKQANLKKYMDQIEEDDENGFYVGILLAVRGANKEELDANTAEVRRRCRKHSIQIVPYYDQQIQALNTLLPIGARRVNNMRSVLTSSYLAFQPFYSWDLIQPGGTWYGINKKTRNPIIGNRKTLKNSNGVIFGHTGSGKSMLLKITEIGQTLINSTDDIFLIDPQNEMKGITQRFRGQYFDLSDPDLRLNPLEIPESLLQKNAKGREEYILSQLQYMEAFLYSIMTGIRPNGIHKSLIYRCVEELYQNTFSKKKPISPVLSDLEAIFQKQREPEARDLYGSLEAYTKHSFLTLEGQSTLSTSSRFVAFGMKNIPELMWEPLMITIMHVLTQRFSYNVEQQRATHFIVDEAQYVCRHETSCNELEKAYLTYRKLGGICTICLQNVSAATANRKIMEIVSNSDFKVLLDQAGDDRNELLQIMELSQKEFEALSDPTPGQSLIVWGGHILQCDSTISRDNPLYHFYSTNFHEAAAENRNVFYSQEADQDEHEDDLESVSKIDTDENRDSVSTFDTDPDKESVELLNGEVEEPISEEELFMYHKVQEADECDEWLDCYGAGILCGVSLLVRRLSPAAA